MVFFFQAEDGIRDLVRSRGLGDVYKRQARHRVVVHEADAFAQGVQGKRHGQLGADGIAIRSVSYTHLTLPTSDLV